MDNKLFKRIVAVAASAVMLTSSAFATVLNNVTYTEGNLGFSYDPQNATKVTYLAYAAREAATGETGNYTDPTNGTKYVFGEIVAVNQLDGSEVVAEGATLNVPVNSDLLVVGEDAATNIVLMSGDDKSNSADTKVVTLAQTPAVKVTFMNGAETVATLTATNNAVTAPAAVTKASATSTVTESGKVDFTFYKWTTEDGTTDYDANSSIAVTEDITLYAKYNTGLLLGDIDGNGEIGSRDYGQIKNKYNDKKVNYAVGEPIFVGSDLILGDIDANGEIGSRDYGQVKNKYNDKKVNYAVGEPIYIINK